MTLSFEAEQSRNTSRGIFTLEDGGAWYTMTQFEAISARRAFPCFDEPGYKTPWEITLRVPNGLVARGEYAGRRADDRRRRIHHRSFRARRVRCRRYLVAFAVGPWEFVDLGRVGRSAVPTRIVVPRGRGADTKFAAAAYPELYALLESWFGIPYPFDKLDHAAIPLTVNFAMENAGLITYGVAGLLAKPGDDTPRFRRGAANVGAHEIAHQWFGNLVTTAWWDDIWLNEAFATWIAEKIVDQWKPAYDRGAARIEERAKAIDADTLGSARQIREPVRSRGDIFRAFDAITYEKGATVIGMFEGWLGEEPFRRGVQRYLESRRYGSATAQDFLESLATTSGRPVTPAFDTFLNQNGVPQVDVRLQCGAGGAKVVLTQHRLVPLGSGSTDPRRWQIPVCMRYGKACSTCTLLTETSATVPLEGACPAFVFANAGGRGYYVPDYRRRSARASRRASRRALRRRVREPARRPAPAAPRRRGDGDAGDAVGAPGRAVARPTRRHRGARPRRVRRQYDRRRRRAAALLGLRASGVRAAHARARFRAEARRERRRPARPARAPARRRTGGSATLRGGTQARARLDQGPPRGRSRPSSTSC